MATPTVTLNPVSLSGYPEPTLAVQGRSEAAQASDLLLFAYAECQGNAQHPGGIQYCHLYYRYAGSAPNTHLLSLSGGLFAAGFITITYDNLTTQIPVTAGTTLPQAATLIINNLPNGVTLQTKVGNDLTLVSLNPTLQFQFPTPQLAATPLAIQLSQLAVGTPPVTVSIKLGSHTFTKTYLAETSTETLAEDFKQFLSTIPDVTVLESPASSVYWEGPAADSGQYHTAITISTLDGINGLIATKPITAPVKSSYQYAILGTLEAGDSLQLVYKDFTADPWILNPDIELSFANLQSIWGDQPGSWALNTSPFGVIWQSPLANPTEYPILTVLSDSLVYDATGGITAIPDELSWLSIATDVDSAVENGAFYKANIRAAFLANIGTLEFYFKAASLQGYVVDSGVYQTSIVKDTGYPILIGSDPILKDSYAIVSVSNGGYDFQDNALYTEIGWDHKEVSYRILDQSLVTAIFRYRLKGETDYRTLNLNFVGNDLYKTNLPDTLFTKLAESRTLNSEPPEIQYCLILTDQSPQRNTSQYPPASKGFHPSIIPHILQLGANPATYDLNDSSLVTVLRDNKAQITKGYATFRLKADRVAPTINHVPPTADILAGTSIPITATVYDIAGIASVTLHYKMKTEPSFNLDAKFEHTPMNLVEQGIPLEFKVKQSGVYTGYIPSEYVSLSGLQYYITATDSYGNTAAYPLKSSDTKETPPLEWMPLNLASLLPLSDELIAAVKIYSDVVETISAILAFLASVLRALSAFLISFSDPLYLAVKAIIAVLTTLRNTINDLMKTGVYAFSYSDVGWPQIAKDDTPDATLMETSPKLEPFRFASTSVSLTTSHYYDISERFAEPGYDPRGKLLSTSRPTTRLPSQGRRPRVRVSTSTDAEIPYVHELEDLINEIATQEAKLEAQAKVEQAKKLMPPPVGRGPGGFFNAIEKTFGNATSPPSVNAPLFSPEAQVYGVIIVAGTEHLPDIKPLLDAFDAFTTNPLDSLTGLLKEKWDTITSKYPYDTNQIAVSSTYSPDWEKGSLQDIPFFGWLKPIVDWLDKAIANIAPASDYGDLLTILADAIDAKAIELTLLAAAFDAFADKLEAFFTVAGFYALPVDSYVSLDDDANFDPDLLPLKVPITPPVLRMLDKARSAKGLPLSENAYTVGLMLTSGSPDFVRVLETWGLVDSERGNPSLFNQIKNSYEDNGTKISNLYSVQEEEISNAADAVADPWKDEDSPFPANDYFADPGPPPVSTSLSNLPLTVNLAGSSQEEVDGVITQQLMALPESIVTITYSDDDAYVNPQLKVLQVDPSGAISLAYVVNSQSATTANTLVPGDPDNRKRQSWEWVYKVQVPTPTVPGSYFTTEFYKNTSDSEGNYSSANPVKVEADKTIIIVPSYGVET